MDTARYSCTGNSVAGGNVTNGTVTNGIVTDVGVPPAGLRPVPVLPACRVAVRTELPCDTAIRLRWDVDTGWASLATAQPVGKPRFLGFAQLTAAGTERAMRVAQVLDALRAAGFTVLADTAAVDGLRDTWVRHGAPGSPPGAGIDDPVEPMTVSGGH